MYLTGRVQAVITEDSDLLAFGVKVCFFKMDKNGQGFEINLDNLHLVEELNFKKFNLDSLLITCILSGCDYIDSIKGIGFKKAHKLVYENGKDLNTLIKKIRREGKHLIPLNYEHTFEKALLTFKFQRVYCPVKKILVHLNDPKTHEMGALLTKHDNLDFLGANMEVELMTKIANCEVCPISKQPLKQLIEVVSKVDKEKATTRTFFRKNNGCQPKNEGVKGMQKMTKFFGVKPQS